METSIKNTACEALHYQVAKLAHEMGEPWRLRQAELMDALSAHEIMLGVVGDAISWELLKVGAADIDFDTETIKVICRRCRGVIQASPKKLIEAMKFYRTENLMSLLRQWHIRIPFIHKDITVSLWDVGNPVLPKVFMR
jgi:hypothetical protein